jgi:uncharacterized RDD family membrane protein YckC
VTGREQDSGEDDSLLASGVRFFMRPARALAGSVAPAAEETVDEILAGPLPEIIGRSIGEHRVLERIVAEAATTDDFAKSIVAGLESERTAQIVREVLASPAMGRLLADVVESGLRPELTNSLLESPEFNRALRNLLSNPEVRHALTRQSTGLVSEAAEAARINAAEADGRVERWPRHLFRKETRATAEYGGVATRGLALVIDALLIGLTFLVGSALLGLVASLVGHLRPHWLVGLLLGSGYLLLSILYFVAFWATAGRTPGMHLMHLRVVTHDGKRPGVVRSAIRLVGLWLAIIPFFAGFLPTLVDDRRRDLPDFLAGTFVVYDDKRVTADLRGRGGATP